MLLVTIGEEDTTSWRWQAGQKMGGEGLRLGETGTGELRVSTAEKVPGALCKIHLLFKQASHLFGSIEVERH